MLGMPMEEICNLATGLFAKLFKVVSRHKLPRLIYVHTFELGMKRLKESGHIMVRAAHTLEFGTVVLAVL